MKNDITKGNLIDFEKWTEETFNAGKLRSPVHLSGGNEDQIIEIFKEVKLHDWVFTTYRSHYHALLKGVPEQRLKDWILDNKSIHFMDSEHRVFSSAIVGGTLSIALGAAMAIKKKHEEERIMLKEAEFCEIPEDEEPFTKVWCFIGDMTASLGVFNDCWTYAVNHKLPITFVIENNELSTDTKTCEVWGVTQQEMDDHLKVLSVVFPEKIKYYKYTRVHPHYGTGKFVAEIWKDVIKQDDVRNKGF